MLPIRRKPQWQHSPVVRWRQELPPSVDRRHLVRAVVSDRPDQEQQHLPSFGMDCFSWWSTQLIHCTMVSCKCIGFSAYRLFFFHLELCGGECAWKCMLFVLKIVSYACQSMNFWEIMLLLTYICYVRYTFTYTLATYHFIIFFYSIPTIRIHNALN